MTKKKLIYLYSFILAFYIIYFSSLLIGKSIFTNILTLVGSTIATLSLFYATLKSKTYKISYAFLTFGCFLWIISDALIIFGKIFLDIQPGVKVPYNFVIVDISFIIDILFAGCLLNVYFSRKDHVHRFQMIWDNIAIILCSIGFLWSIFLKEHYYEIIGLKIDTITSFLFIFVNIFVLIMILSLCLSLKNSKINIKYKLITVGIVINSFTDLLQALSVKYIESEAIHAAYMSTLFFITIGAMLEVYEPSSEKETSEIYSNIGNIKMSLSLFLVPILLEILKGINFSEALYFSIIIFIYYMISKYIESTVKIQSLLDKERKITDKYKLLAKAIDQSPVAIIITDQDGNIEFINPQFSKIMECPNEEILGKNLCTNKHNILNSQISKELWKKMQLGESWKGEFVEVKNNGEEYFGEIIAEPIKNDQGIVTNYIFINEDMTEIKKANKKISDQLYFLTQLIDAVPNPIFYQGVDKCILGCNKAFEEAFGITRENIIGKSIEELNYFFDAQDIIDVSESSGPIKIKFADQKIHQLLYQKCEFKFSDSMSGGMICIMVDITELKEKELELLNEKNFLDAVLNNIPVRIHVKDAKTLKFVKVNKAALDYVQKSEEEIINCTDYDLFPEELAKKLVETDKSVIEKGISVTEIELHPGNEEYKVRYVQSSKVPVMDTEGKLMYLLGMSEDISELKKKEEELNNAVSIAQEATQSKTMFLANMSHEIRTPMNAIIGMAYLALKTELSDKQRDYILKIHNAGTSLLGIINDILDFSKIECNKLDLEYKEFNIEDVMSNVYNIINPNAYNKGIEFLAYINPHIPQNLIGDSLRLGQVIINLLSNAVKFTNKGQVSIDIAKISEFDNKVELQFRIKDTGIGMTEEQINKLFKAFTQADGSTTRKYGGTGLGLTISKTLVEMMDGIITVESEYEKGSTFTFTAIFEISKINKKRAIPETLNNLHVLVVDDNLFSREIMGEYLTTLGFRADIVSSGEKAISAIKQYDNDDPYAAVFMDWQMPDMDGMEASHIIKESKYIKNKPRIVIVTAFEREDVRKKVEESNLDGYLIKPINQSIMFDTLMSILSDKSEEISQTKVSVEKDYKLSGIRLLLAEDNEINRQIAIELLQNQGIIIDTASNGREAVNKVIQNNYDIVLMDLQMPVLDGFEATKLIRKNNKSIPIIAITARTMIEERQRCMREGMNDHIAKPLDPHALFTTIYKWLSENKKNELLMAYREVSENQELIYENVEIPEILGINIKYGLERVANNSLLYKKLLIKYAKEQEQQVNKLKDAINSSDLDTAKRIVHTSRGVSGNIGALEMKIYLDSIEKVLNAGGKSESIQNMISKLEVMVNDISMSINEVFYEETDVSTDNEEYALEAGREYIEKLKDLLMDNDSEAVDYFNSKRNIFIRCLSKKKNRLLRTTLNNFDFDKALSIIEECNFSDYAEKGGNMNE